MAARCRNESAIRNVENVVFITGRGSASASELVITSLQPYENVSLVGERTYGKPVGQYGLRTFALLIAMRDRGIFGP